MSSPQQRANVHQAYPKRKKESLKKYIFCPEREKERPFHFS